MGFEAWTQELSDTAQVRVFLPAGAAGIFGFTKFVVEGFSYSVRPDALVIMFDEVQNGAFSKAENIAARLLTVLSHTPISGVGHNFEFRDVQPKSQDLSQFTVANQDLLDQIPEGWSSMATNITVSVRNKAGNVIVNISRILDAGAITVKFNFHHPVTSAAEAIAVLHGNDGYAQMEANLEFAKTLINAVYGGTCEN